jgi:SAM-dependent methyltransferase
MWPIHHVNRRRMDRRPYLRRLRTIDPRGSDFTKKADAGEGDNMPVLLERDLAEIKRSAAEASKTEIQNADLERYMNPPNRTLYALEYAFHLLGDVRGKTVLDLGCGSGENIVPLARRGAKVMGIDISPELIDVARARLELTGTKAELRVESAYETGLPDRSVDLIFMVALVHHLDIPICCEEIRRILVPRGCVIFKEPIRFARGYAEVRSLLPSFGDVSEFEHPLTPSEMAELVRGFEVEGLRYFRLPFVSLVERIVGVSHRWIFQASNWCINNLAFTEKFATCVVGRMVR